MYALNAGGDNMSKPNILTTTISIKDIDLLALETFKPFCFGEKVQSYDLPCMVVDMIQAAIVRVGGYAIIECWGESIECLWKVPDTESSYLDNFELKTRKTSGALEVMYVSHMLQVGLLSSPNKVISELAYSGNGFELASLLILFDVLNLNKYIAERDLTILAGAMIDSARVWTSLGLVLFSNGKFDFCRPVLERALTLEPNSLPCLKYMTVIETASNPKSGVAYGERLLRVASLGGVVDSNIRSTYAFALLSAGMKKEAGEQFKLVCGVKKPKMTLLQWVKWGYKYPAQLLPEELLDPTDIDFNS